jgi:hypothetical protein
MTATATTTQSVSEVLVSKTTVRTEYRVFGTDPEGVEFLSAPMSQSRVYSECAGRAAALPTWTFRVVARIVTESVSFVEC